MSTHRIFAQVAFERALGNAAIDALVNAVRDKAHFDHSTQWPTDTEFAGKTGDDLEALSAELQGIVDDRLRDVLDGPGLRCIQQGELFYSPNIVKLVLDAEADTKTG